MSEEYARSGGHGMFPFRSDFTDALGLSAVHTNRTLKIHMRSQLVAISDRKARIEDIQQLRELAKFEGKKRLIRPLL
jgi:hypothetical protein